MAPLYVQREIWPLNANENEQGFNCSHFSANSAVDTYRLSEAYGCYRLVKHLAFHFKVIPT